MPIRSATDHKTVVGYDTLYVCRPSARHRPRCHRLVVEYKHTKNCVPCYRNYPPGAEYACIPEEGRWAEHDSWLAA